MASTTPTLASPAASNAAMPARAAAPLTSGGFASVLEQLSADLSGATAASPPVPSKDAPTAASPAGPNQPPPATPPLLTSLQQAAAPELAETPAPTIPQPTTVGNRGKGVERKAKPELGIVPESSPTVAAAAQQTMPSAPIPTADTVITVSLPSSAAPANNTLPAAADHDAEPATLVTAGAAVASSSPAPTMPSVPRASSGPARNAGQPALAAQGGLVTDDGDDDDAPAAASEPIAPRAIGSAAGRTNATQPERSPTPQFAAARSPTDPATTLSAVAQPDTRASAAAPARATPAVAASEPAVTLKSSPETAPLASETPPAAAISLLPTAPAVASANASRPAQEPAPPPSPATQVAQAIAEPVKVVLTSPVQSGPSTPHVTTIQITPNELGRVDIRIERIENGPAKIELVAERPETLSRLVHDQSQLHQALDQAGVPQHGRTLEFSLAPPATDASASSSNAFSNGTFENGTPNNGASGNGSPRQNAAYQNSSSTDPEDASSAPATQSRTIRAGIDITA